MSRAFVNEDQTDQGRGAPVTERVPSGNPNYVTPRGLAALVRQADALRAARRDAEAIADEDRRSAEIARIDRELRYFVSRVESAIPVDQSHLCEHEVHFGSEVTVIDAEGEEHTYIIVGEDEADVSKGLISWTSPLAAALINARTGDAVTWKRPSGDKELEVIRVRNAILDEPWSGST